ncbi:MAG: amino acid adenylation domain-containing protein [Planctomycetota bacterium]
MAGLLHDLLGRAARDDGDRVAVVDPARDQSLTYAELNAAAEHVAAALRARGVGVGDRIGVSGKSVGVLAALFGTLKTGAAYVPVDASAPVPRSAGILRDCAVAAAFVANEAAEGYAAELGHAAGQGLAPTEPLFGFPSGLTLVDGPARSALQDAAAAPPEGLAYILYTSGSTGRPKGVMHTHASALAFVDWCSEALAPTETDRFSSHAPFHFDLSIFDIFVAVKHAATLVLIGDDLGKHPSGLAALIAEQRLTVWYSTPSVLRLLVEFGKLNRHDHSALRLVLFAGEVFPIKHLRALQAAWPAPRYANLYGPTETNVCTWFEVPATIPDVREAPLPIGKPCSDDRAKVVDENGDEVSRGAEGELWISGGSVMQGYFGDPDKTSGVFTTDAEGTAWYHTGDLVVEEASGDYAFVGRRDRMVKRRGYRIELGEIEAALYRHERVLEAAALALTDGDGSVTIKAVLSCRDGGTLTKLVLKQWCAAHLPLYMVPDAFECRDALPKTSTDKIDYQALKGH